MKVLMVNFTMTLALSLFLSTPLVMAESSGFFAEVFVGYTYTWNNHYGKFHIYDSSLSKTTTAQWITGTSNTQISETVIDCLSLSTGHVLVVFSEMSDSYKGKFWIVNSSGTEVVAETQFESSAIRSVTASKISDSKFLISYSLDSSKVGKYVVYNYDSTSATLQTSATTFSLEQVYYIEASPIGTSSVLLNYRNLDSDSSSRQMQVVGPF
jgi:hypothetical protein